MTTLTDFLLDRIAEDEEAATYLRDQYPHETGPSHLSGNMDNVRVTTGFGRVLAECEAKRRIVAAHTAWDENDWQSPPYFSAPMDEVLSYLALPYADHPDYREEWRP